LRALRRIEQLASRFNAILAYIAGAVLLLMMLLTVVDVTGRFTLNKPIRGGIEIAQVMMAYVVFFAFAYALIKGAHVRVSLLLERFPLRIRLAMEVLSAVLGVFLFGFLTWGSWRLFWESWIAREWMPAAIRVPWWLPKFALPLGMFFITVQFLIYMVINVSQLRSRE